MPSKNEPIDDDKPNENPESENQQNIKIDDDQMEKPENLPAEKKDENEEPTPPSS